jgi:hypothetical protein
MLLHRDEILLRLGVEGKGRTMRKEHAARRESLRLAANISRRAAYYAANPAPLCTLTEAEWAEVAVANRAEEAVEKALVAAEAAAAGGVEVPISALDPFRLTPANLDRSQARRRIAA